MHGMTRAAAKLAVNRLNVLLANRTIDSYNIFEAVKTGLAFTVDIGRDRSYLYSLESVIEFCEKLDTATTH